MRVFLDSCCIQRPFDDQSQLRIKLESEAVLGILSEVEAGRLTLISSESVEFEIRSIPDTDRREEGLAILALAAVRLTMTTEIVQTAKFIESQGLAAIDALHLAFAEHAEAQYFTTCDDHILRRAAKLQQLKCQVVSPLDLVKEIVK